MGVNCVYAAGWRILGDLASLFDTTLASTCYANQHRVEGAIQQRMWNSTLNRFVSTYRNKQGVTVQTPVETVQSLFPLLLETLPQATQVQLRRGYRQHDDVNTERTNAGIDCVRPVDKYVQVLAAIPRAFCLKYFVLSAEWC